MLRLFNSWAAGWDAHTEGHGVDRLAALNAGLDAVDARDASPSRVVDLGCGTGAGTRMLAERYPRAWVTGVDSSPEMIAAATRNGASAGSSARFTVGRLQDVDLDDESVDLVVLLNAPPAFDEIERLLTPGGTVVIAASRGSSTAFYSGEQRLARGFRRYGVSTVAAGSAPPGEFYVGAKR
ncbi:MAG: class I SAM-dependent methyltransferase [Actinobacteria bacterium]|nr:class I SAM-dependent methyltransferase [Actinomycetota bacterium]